MSTMKLIVITNDADHAALAVRAGVTRIMVDLETIGKAERQPEGSLISAHHVEDISAIRRLLPDAELMVRINPYGAQSATEIDEACTRGADYIMLPMVMHRREMAEVKRLVGSRAKLVPLIEHREALQHCAEILDAGADEAYLGLNDLHLSLRQHFMFEPLADGLVDKFADHCHARGLAFGFGGVGKIGNGVLPADLVIAEHARMGSTRVIVSRAFDRALASENQPHDAAYVAGISDILEAYDRACRRTDEEIASGRMACKAAIGEVARRIELSHTQYSAKNTCQR